MQTVLILSSSPLHSLWALALAAGAFSSARCVLWRFEPNAEQPDFIIEALQHFGRLPLHEVRTLPPVGRRARGNRRAAVKRLQAEVRALAPDLVLTGNDGRFDFHAVAQAVPQARFAYLDDGTGSYVPAPLQPASRWAQLRRWLRRNRRRLRYGVSGDKPQRLGTTPLIGESWLAFPQHAHEDLAKKPVQAIDAAWLRLPQVQQRCAEAIERAGMWPESLRGVDLLLALPLDWQIIETPGLKARLEAVANSVLARGGRLAIKRHPRSTAMPLNLRCGDYLDVPQRLPLEVLAPLLGGLHVVGTMTTALIYLHWLGAGVRVEAIVPDTATDHPVVRFYETLGIAPFA